MLKELERWSLINNNERGLALIRFVKNESGEVFLLHCSRVVVAGGGAAGLQGPLPTLPPFSSFAI